MPSPDIVRLILLIVSFACLVGLFIRPFWGVVSYLIIMLLRPGLHYPVLGSMRIELVIGLLVISVVFFSGRLKFLKPSTEPICKWAFIVFVVMAVSMLQAFDFDTSWDRMNEFVKVIFFFLMITTLFDNDKDIEIFIFVFVLTTALLSYEVIYNNMHGMNIKVSAGGGRVDYAVVGKGRGSGHVAMANITLQAIPFIYFIFVCSMNKLYKQIGIVLFLLCLYGVVLSGSRGGFVGLIVLYAGMLYYSKKRLLIGCMGVVAFMLMPIVSSDGYMEYISSITGMFTGNIGLSGSSRSDGLRHGFEMMIRRPLLGVGPGCYPVARKAWFGWSLWSHNVYGQLMGDLGILGLVSWFTFVYCYMKGTIDLKKRYAQFTNKDAIYNAIIVATVIRLVGGYATHCLYQYIWYMMAAIIIVKKRINASQYEKSDQKVIKE